MPDTNNTNSAPNGSEVSRVAVKVPPFWPEKPSLWFSQLEGQFELAGVTSDSTKFYYVISNLNNSIALEIEDVITNPPAADKYKKIKEELVKRLSVSQELRTKQLLETEEMGNRTPSQFLRHLRNLAGTAVPDNFLKTIWLSRLPATMQAILATQTSTDLNNVAELADKIKEVSPHGEIAHMSTENHQIQELAMELRELKLQIAELTRNTHRTRSQSRGRFRYRGRSKSRDRPKTGQISDGESECWYHRRFGELAKKCSTPCKYSENETRHLSRP